MLQLTSTMCHAVCFRVFCST